MQISRIAAQLRRFIPGIHFAVVPYDGGRSTIRTDLRTSIGRILFTGAPIDSVELSLVAGSLHPGDTFIDVGANIGLYTLVAARRVGPSGRVVAFEPSRTTRDSLQRNVDLNHLSWVIVRSEGVSDQVGSATLTAFTGDKSGFSSLNPPTDFHSGLSEKIVLTRLDELLSNDYARRVKFIKIDVEGVEVAALRGAAKLLEEVRPDILIEVEPANLIRDGKTIQDLISAIPSFYRAYKVSFDSGALDYSPINLFELKPGFGCNVFLTTRAI